MNYRRCSTPRKDGLTHLFREGAQLTLCDRLITDDYRVRSDEAIPTCNLCVLALTRRMKEQTPIDLREREEA